MKKSKPQHHKPKSNKHNTDSITFLEHLRELRTRLFWVVGFIVIASAAAYPFQQRIIGVLTAPLGKQQLYYLTPIGGFSFVIKLCTYVGVLLAIPMIVYHLYRYLEPIMGQAKRRSVAFYVTASTLLAATGILFAYFVSLPGALHFLTGLNLEKIQAMLTVDSYLSFVITYLVGAALLFQIPLLMLIFNNIKPIPPKKLLSSQRYVVLGSFLIAAVISPTPDIMNQLLMAIPIVLMYEVGVVMIWMHNRRAAKKQTPVVYRSEPEPPTSPEPPQSSTPPKPTPRPFMPPKPAPQVVASRPRPMSSLDGMTPMPRRRMAPMAQPVIAASVPKPTLQPVQQPRVPPQPQPPAATRNDLPHIRVPDRHIRVPQRAIDGLSIRAA